MSRFAIVAFLGVLILIVGIIDWDILKHDIQNEKEKENEEDNS